MRDFVFLAYKQRDFDIWTLAIAKQISDAQEAQEKKLAAEAEVCIERSQRLLVLTVLRSRRWRRQTVPQARAPQPPRLLSLSHLGTPRGCELFKQEERAVARVVVVTQRKVRAQAACRTYPIKSHIVRTLPIY